MPHATQTALPLPSATPALRDLLDTEDRPVPSFTVIGGLVHVEGKPVLCALGKPVRYRATAQVSCQRCGKRQVDVPTEIRTRFEPALGRRMYWHGIAAGVSTRWLRCDECRAMALSSLPRVDGEHLAAVTAVLEHSARARGIEVSRG